ncbi:4Fe-4S single cluster domain-containing protein [Nannocystaceae bacterium ST9]
MDAAPRDVAPEPVPNALRVAVEIADTDAEGPGRRYAIWVQGCPMRCPGCCNPEYLAFRGGQASDAEALIERVLAAHRRRAIEGISLLGGEPFAQAGPLARVAEALRAEGLSVMIYSGYTLAELRAMPEPAIARLLAACDLLVDGRYDRDQPDRERRWIGSRNQVLHVFGDRYAPDDPRFRARETVEIRLVAGELTINGWPWDKKGMP